LGIEDLGEVTEKIGFWMLGAGGTAAVVLGWIMSKRMGVMTMPVWQILAMIVVVWVASAFFAARD